MPFLQDIIHRIETGAGPRYIRYTFIALALLGGLLIYNLRVTRNFGTMEAMDSAQLARNLAEGRGYTTSFVRPFSLALIRDKTREAPGTNSVSQRDAAKFREAHPDISNPPVYPAVLAALMKVLPFEYTVFTDKPYWSSKGRFSRFQADFLIHWFNQFLFLGVVVLTYIWGKRLFDHSVGITASLLLLSSDVLWRFSTSGISTMLVMLILTGAGMVLTAVQREMQEPKHGSTWPLLMAALAGLLLGLAALTRYGTMWLLAPALVLIAVFGGVKRVPMAIILTVTFAAVLVPWMGRNMGLSGTPFGTASYDVFKGMSVFGEHRLDRSLEPELQFSIRAIWMKLLISSRTLLQEELFTFGSGWIIGLFLVSLTLGFRNPAIRQMRYWVVISLVVLFVVQALGRTHLSEDSPRINSENYLVLLLPIVAIYAAGFFQVLLEQIQVPTASLRQAVRALLLLLAGMPLILSVLPPRTTPIQYPPYYPPTIQHIAHWYRADELLMSDVPWAVAWYGDRPCVWLTLDATGSRGGTDTETFFAINDRIRPIFGVYLTPKTMDQRFQSEIVRGGNDSWGALVVATLLTKTSDGRFDPPRRFPLRTVAGDLLPEQLFLADWERWGSTE